MKKNLFGLAFAGITFFVGVFAGVPSIDGIGPKEVIDDIFTCPILDDCTECSTFNSTQVRIKGEFDPMQDVDLGTMGSRRWMRVICRDDAVSCARLFVKSPRGFEITKETMNVDVIGYITNHSVDPHPLQRGTRVRLLTITQVIDAEIARSEFEEDRDVSGRGRASR
jgi:hypothetical protein